MPSSIDIEFKGYKIHVLDLETMVAIKRNTTDPEEQYRLKIYETTLRLRDQTPSR